MNTLDTPRIYVACLAAYNNGKLHGAWIDCDQDADSIREEVAAMLKASPEAGAEEWAIHDYTGFGGVTISECEGFDEVAELAHNIATYGDAFAAYIEHVGADYGDVSGFADTYQGEHADEKGFAQQLAEDIGAVDADASWPSYCIDWEWATRELMMDYFSEPSPGGGVFIFRHI